MLKKLDKLLLPIYLLVGLIFSGTIGLLDFDRQSQKYEAAFLKTMQDTIQYLQKQSYCYAEGRFTICHFNFADFSTFQIFQGPISKDIEDRRFVDHSFWVDSPFVIEKGCANE